MKQVLRNNDFEVTVNKDFEAVINHCSKIKRDGQKGTWITESMKLAYIKLHELGYAKSIEVWLDNELVGGLYGVSIGRLFFGESMFHTATDASKVAFVALCRLLRQQGCPLVDCQMPNPHIMSLGVETISRSEFMLYLLKNSKLKSNEWINWPSLQGALCIDTMELADTN